MTGSTPLTVSRKTSEGYTISYRLALPWNIRLEDYSEGPKVIHGENCITLSHLIWNGEGAEGVLIPLNVLIPRTDLPLEAHTELTSLDLLEDFENLYELSCSPFSKLDPHFDRDLWLPKRFGFAIYLL